jgi:hypothetical protein
METVVPLEEIGYGRWDLGSKEFSYLRVRPYRGLSLTRLGSGIMAIIASTDRFGVGDFAKTFFFGGSKDRVACHTFETSPRKSGQVCLLLFPNGFTKFFSHSHRPGFQVLPPVSCSPCRCCSISEVGVVTMQLREPPGGLKKNVVSPDAAIEDPAGLCSIADNHSQRPE